MKKYIEISAFAILTFGILWIAYSSGLFQSVKPKSPFDKAVTLIGIPFVIVMVLAVHEVGHLLVGLRHGFRFELFVVGSFGFRRDKNRVQFFWNRNIGYYGGIAATLPVDNDPDNIKKLARVVIAGPIASLLFAAVCFGIGLLLHGPIAFLFLTSAVVSLGIVLATTIPSKSGIFFSDRKRFQRLIHPGKAQNVEVALLNITGIFNRDESYRNIEKSDIEIVMSDDDPNIRHYGLFNMMCYEVEVEREISDSILAEYESACAKIPKAVVETYRGILEEWKSKAETLGN
jgi:hypothetical protein